MELPPYISYAVFGTIYLLIAYQTRPIAYFLLIGAMAV